MVIDVLQSVCNKRGNCVVADSAVVGENADIVE